MSTMDLKKIEEGVRLILEGIGEDPDREGLQKTPARVARMYEECCAGLYEDPAVHFETTFDEHHEELVIVHDIPFYSLCEHHLAPFFGKAHVAYIPASEWAYLRYLKVGSFGRCICPSSTGTRALDFSSC